MKSSWKKIFIAVALSALIWPGAGQLYNREFKKGWLLIGVTFLVVLSFILAMGSQAASLIPHGTTQVDLALAQQISRALAKNNPWIFRGFNLFMSVTWVYAVVDAFLDARSPRVRPSPPPSPFSPFPPLSP